VNIGPQALIWFGIAGGAAAFAVSALWRRFVKKDPQAIRSGAGFLLFVACLLLFALGALVAGVVTIRTGGS